MKFEQVTAYGSAGSWGGPKRGDVTARIIASDAETVEEVRLLVLAAPKLLAALDEITELLGDVDAMFSRDDADRINKQLRKNCAAIAAAKGESS